VRFKKPRLEGQRNSHMSVYESGTNHSHVQPSANDKTRAIKSINRIEPSAKNVEKLFRAACQTVKESFLAKKLGFELPEHLTRNGIPAEAIAFDRATLILVASQMGVRLTSTQAIEAILVARKPTATT